MKHENNLYSRRRNSIRGAKEVNESFLWNVDMAFVIDRRGTNDIVTHNYSQEFCSAEFGRSLERIAHSNMQGKWRVANGGFSDKLFGHHKVFKA